MSKALMAVITPRDDTAESSRAPSRNHHERTARRRDARSDRPDTRPKDGPEAPDRNFRQNIDRQQRTKPDRETEPTLGADPVLHVTGADPAVDGLVDPVLAAVGFLLQTDASDGEIADGLIDLEAELAAMPLAPVAHETAEGQFAGLQLHQADGTVITAPEQSDTGTDIATTGKVVDPALAMPADPANKPASEATTTTTSDDTKLLVDGEEGDQPLLKLAPDATSSDRGPDHFNSQTGAGTQTSLQGQQQTRNDTKVVDEFAIEAGSSKTTGGQVDLSSLSPVGEAKPLGNTVTPAAPVTPPAPMTPEQANAGDRMIARQVERALLSERPSGERVLQLRLTPPELGTVRVEIVEHQGRITVKLGAEDNGVRHSLERALPLLRQELRQSDAPITELTMADQSWFGQQHGQTQHEHDGQRRGNRAGPRFSINGMEAPDATPTREDIRLGGTISADQVNARA